MCRTFMFTEIHAIVRACQRDREKWFTPVVFRRAQPHRRVQITARCCWSFTAVVLTLTMCLFCRKILVETAWLLFASNLESCWRSTEILCCSKALLSTVYVLFISCCSNCQWYGERDFTCSVVWCNVIPAVVIRLFHGLLTFLSGLCDCDSGAVTVDCEAFNWWLGDGTSEAVAVDCESLTGVTSCCSSSMLWWIKSWLSYIPVCASWLWLWGCDSRLWNAQLVAWRPAALSRDARCLYSTQTVAS